MEPPMAFITRKQVKAESGMERSTAKVARGLQSGQRQTNATFFQQVDYRSFHENRLIEHHCGFQDIRDVDQMLDGLFDSVDDRDGVAIAALLQDRDVNGFLSVNPHNVGLNRAGVFRLTHVSDQHRAEADALERDLVDLLDFGDLAVGVNVVVAVANAHVAGRQNQVGTINGRHHVHEAQLVSFQLDGIDEHLDLPVRPAKRLRHGSAPHISDLIPDLKLRQVFQLRFAEALALQRKQADRQAGGVELQYHGRQGSGREPAQVRHGEIGDVAERGVGISAGLKIDSDEADAGEGARFDVVDVAAQSEKSLEGIRDVGFNLLRRHAGVKGGHDNDRDIDLREQVHGHAHHGGDANHRDHQADHDDEIRICQGKLGHQ